MLIEMEYDFSPIDNFLDIEGDGILVEDVFEADEVCHGGLNPFYGRKHTDETKAILSKKGKQSTADRRCWGEKNGMYGSARYGKLNPMWGKSHTEETKRKISEANKGKKGWNKGLPCQNKEALSKANSRCYTLVNPEGEIIKIKNLTQFCKDNDLNLGCMKHVVNRRNRQHKGWRLWESR